MKTIHFALFLSFLFTSVITSAQVNSKYPSDIPAALKTAPPEVSPTVRGFIEKVDGHKVTIKRTDSSLTVNVIEPENISSFKKGDLVKFQKGKLEKLTEKKPLNRMKPDFKPVVPPKPALKSTDKLKTGVKTRQNNSK